jgi:hypothetical protein
MVRPWKDRVKAISFKYIDPTYTNRAGYKFVKWFEDDFDFEPTNEWIRIHNPTYVVYDDISNHFHAGWILNEWTPVNVVQDLRRLMKSSTGGDNGKMNWLVTSPAYNPKGRKYCENFTKDGTLRRQIFLTKGQMTTFTVDELNDKYKTKSLDDIFSSPPSDEPSITMDRLRTIAANPSENIKDAVAARLIPLTQGGL